MAGLGRPALGPRAGATRGKARGRGLRGVRDGSADPGGVVAPVGAPTLIPDLLQVAVHPERTGPASGYRNWGLAEELEPSPA